MTGVEKRAVCAEGFAVVEQNRAGLCTFRLSVGEKPEFEYSGYQINHNGQEQIIQKLQYNRMKKIKFQDQVKLEEGANSISVRMFFKGTNRRISQHLTSKHQVFHFVEC